MDKKELTGQEAIDLFSRCKNCEFGVIKIYDKSTPANPLTYTQTKAKREINYIKCNSKKGCIYEV